MSSDGDHLVVQNALNDNLADATDVPFNEKKWTFITDSTSNSGSFTSGQIQFDLSNFASQSQWVNLKEAMIEFPVKITTQIITAGTGAETTKSIAQVNTAIIKSGWHQWISSAQVIINGQTLQAAQPWENVSAQFKILSSWSQDELKKYGVTCGVALDDMTGDSEVSTTIANTSGIGNAAYATVAANVKGLDVINNQSVLFNKGITTRSGFTNNEIGLTSSVQATILGATNMKLAGRNNSACTAAGSNTANTYVQSAYYMATCRLRDLCDIDQFPPVKNLKGFVYLSFNSAAVQLTGTAGSAVMSAVNYSTITGQTTPFLINNSSTGILLGNYATTAPVVEIRGNVDATTTGQIGSSGPLLTNARMLIPYYIANPRTDSALSIQNKFFTTLEKIVNPITLAAAASINYTITSGVSNPRRLIILPMYSNLGGVTNLTNPEISAFDSVPATSSPYAILQNFQVYVGNRPIYQTPIFYDFEQWLTEQEEMGVGGTELSGQTSGLLTQHLFNQNHRFYTVNLARRMDSDDGGSKSVQVSFTNPSATFAMKCICIVQYEKRWNISTNTCLLNSV